MNHHDLPLRKNLLIPSCRSNPLIHGRNWNKKLMVNTPKLAEVEEEEVEEVEEVQEEHSILSWCHSWVEVVVEEEERV